MYMQKIESVFVFGRVYSRHVMAHWFRQHLRNWLKNDNFDWLANICL